MKRARVNFVAVMVLLVLGLGGLSAVDPMHTEPTAWGQGAGVAKPAPGPSLSLDAPPAALPCIDGSGTRNYIAKFTDTSTIGDSAIYENLGKVGINTATPQARLEVVGNEPAGYIQLEPGMFYGTYSAGVTLHEWRDHNKLWLSAYDESFGNLIGTYDPAGGTSQGLGIMGGSYMAPFERFVVNADETFLGYSRYPGTGNPCIGGNGVGNLYVRGNIGVGTTEPDARLTVKLGAGEGAVLKGYNASGEVIVEIGEGLDYAEVFPTAQDQLPSGTVMSIDPDHPGNLMMSTTAYDRRVAGIIAGANGIDSGVRLGSRGEDGDQPVALAGRVYCNVDTQYGAVHAGDLLTTSPTAGHAMVVKDFSAAHGAILGKAMEGLPAGQKGQVLVLVTLQ